MRRVMAAVCAAIVSGAAVGVIAREQRSAQALPADAPDQIFYNAKIVTVDDASMTSAIGTIAQALALRGDTIVATGTNDKVRALAGPGTKQVDLKGRTVLPSFILTHEHPTDWAWTGPEALSHVFEEGNPDLVVRFLKGTGEEQIASWESTLRDAVAVAKPGQWILLSSDWGGNFENMPVLWKGFLKEVTPERLDQLAPNNPVRVKNAWIDGVLNTKGMQALRKAFPEAKIENRGNRGESGRQLEPDVILQNKTEINAKLLKSEMELWAAHGITTFGSSPYAPGNFKSLVWLDSRGEMPARFAWGYSGPDLHFDTLRMIAGMVGHGSKYLWNVGAQGEESGGSCTTISASPTVKAREECAFTPGSTGRRVIDDIVKSGGRIATMHSGGDKDIDNLLDAIEKGSKEAGLTLEDIRRKRHAFDHSSGAPRPDQIPRIKRLGMMVSMINTVLWENRTDYDISFRARNYGIEYANYTVPRKSVTEAGIMNTQEIDRGLPHFIFYNVWVGMTRFNAGEQRTYAPREATDRITQLKALTTWGSRYVLREDRMGSLEPGKLADFVVLDRDFLTIPQDDIPKTKVLMTVVGGKAVHLLPQLADEIGWAAAGPATWSTKPLERRYVFKGPPAGTSAKQQ
ncbi:MAG: amidohydrolase family protein [Vicinamibacterales bacterium]